MPTSFRSIHLRICLGAIALMVTIPFLLAHHYNPVPSFFQEWTAAALGLVALTALLRRDNASPLEVPEIALLPIGLMLIAVLQWLFLPEVLVDRLLMLGCYMVWTILMAILGRRLAEDLRLPVLADVVATAILAGALLEALTGGVQLAGLARLPWVFPIDGGGLKGNLAQPNNFADYLWLGICSAMYLRARGWLGVATTAGSLLVLVPFAMLSGSRSVWLYAAGIFLFSVLWTWRLKDGAAKTCRHWSLCALCGCIAFQAAVSSGWMSFLGDFATSGSRLAAQGSYDPMRMALWRTALGIFLENPLLGAGFGQYTRQFHFHVLDLMPQRLPGLPEHAHNLLLNLLAEMGLAAGLLLLAFGLRWTVALARAPRTPEFWWIAATMLVLGIHANLEYPLWYGFFLGIAALLAGAGSQQNHRVQAGRTAPYAMAAVLALGSLTLYNLYQDYSLLEDTLNGRITARSAEERQERTAAALERLARESLLRPYVDLALAGLMPEDATDLGIKLENCERAQRFSASRDIVFKCAHLLALAGRDDEGRQALRRAVAAYPDRAEQVLEQWQKRGPKEPAIARLVAAFPPIVQAQAPSP